MKRKPKPEQRPSKPCKHVHISIYSGCCLFCGEKLGNGYADTDFGCGKAADEL